MEKRPAASTSKCFIICSLKYRGNESINTIFSLYQTLKHLNVTKVAKDFKIHQTTT